MEFGVRLPHSGPLASPEVLRRVTQHAEQLGFDAVLAHDHVTWGIGEKYHFYCGGLELADAHPRPTEFYDAFSTMAYLAGATQRIRFVSAAIVLAWRHPLMAARLALTLHHLSGKRFVLGVCVGNVPRDFEVLEVSWDRRAEIAEEHLEVVVRALREEGLLSFQGTHVRFTDAELRPKAPDLPIWYGGTAPRGLVRAARYCDGLLVGGPPQVLATLRAREVALRERHGRAGGPFTMATLAMISIDRDAAKAEAAAARTVEERERASWLRKQRQAFTERDSAFIGAPEAVAARVDAYRAAGVDFIGFGFVGPSLDRVLDSMALFADEVMPRFRTAAASEAVT